jgi:hypothetical protein
MDIPSRLGISLISSPSFRVKPPPALSLLFLLVLADKLPMAIAVDLPVTVGSLVLTKFYLPLHANQHASDSFWKKKNQHASDSFWKEVDYFLSV